MPNNGLTQQTRVAGSGFTIFTFGGFPIAFCQVVSHQSPSLVGGYSVIQPMDEPYPIEILTPMAAGVGTLQLNLYDMWGDRPIGSKVWDRLGYDFQSNNKNPNGPFGGVGEGYGDRGSAPGVGSNSTTAIFAGANDIVEIAILQAQADYSKTAIVQYIRPLPGAGGIMNSGSPTYGTPYFVRYNKCRITDVRDNEQINVGTVEVIKQITVNYAYSTRSGSGSNKALQIRNNQLTPPKKK